MLLTRSTNLLVPLAPPSVKPNKVSKSVVKSAKLTHVDNVPTVLEDIEDITESISIKSLIPSKLTALPP